MVEVTGDQRHIEIAALANRFAIVDGFQHGEPARMSLNCSGQGVQMSGSRMRCQSLPLRKRTSRSPDSRVDICSRSLRNFRDLFSGSGISCVEERAFDWLAPFAINEMPKPSLMPVKPQQCILRVFRRRTIF